MLTSVFMAAYMFVVPPENIVSVYDGDTFRIKVETKPNFTDSISVRIVGLDAPEIRGKCDREKSLAIKSRDNLRSLLKSKHVFLYDVKPDKYFRIAAHAYTEDKNIAEIQISEGLGRSYYGGKRESWCTESTPVP